jgi:hypothetical protein
MPLAFRGGDRTAAIGKLAAAGVGAMSIAPNSDPEL